MKLFSISCNARASSCSVQAAGASALRHSTPLTLQQAMFYLYTACSLSLFCTGVYSVCWLLVLRAGCCRCALVWSIEIDRTSPGPRFPYGTVHHMLHVGVPFLSAQTRVTHTHYHTLVPPFTPHVQYIRIRMLQLYDRTCPHAVHAHVRIMPFIGAGGGGLTPHLLEPRVRPGVSCLPRTRDGSYGGAW